MRPRNNFKKLITFTKSESTAVILVTLVITFGLTFRKWGFDGFNPAVGIYNFSFVFLGMLVAVFLHELFHKIVGAIQGYNVLISKFNVGLVVSAFVTLYSQGYIPLVTPNLLELDARPDLRMNRFRKYNSSMTQAMIAMGGIIGTIVSILFFKVLYQLTGNELFWLIMAGSLLHGVLSLIPFELISLINIRYQNKGVLCVPGDGTWIVWWSPVAYVFTFAFLLFYGGIALITSTVSLVFTIILAAITAFAYNIIVR